MFLKILERFFKRERPQETQGTSSATSLDTAFELMLKGEKHRAITEFRRILSIDPYNIRALNDMGACLFDIGDTPAAYAALELAYSLDDSFMPVVANHARILLDEKRSEEALPLLERAKVGDPNFSHVDAVYGPLCLSLADVPKAKHFDLRAWLGSFDNLRMANCHLFTWAFDDFDEAKLASEHRFWAETCLRTDLGRSSGLASGVKPSTATELAAYQGTRKIRIGYWSPDFRSHSVRYFSRPLIENHDLAEFEVYLYHDSPIEDEQTAVVRGKFPNFHQVSLLPDSDLFELIKSHQLDIIVELAGHSSNNRINLLTERFAPVQISGLGYPPTTGLQSIDAKVMDRHIYTPHASRYYTEEPMVLPNSLWCFDPCETVPEPKEPPSKKNGYITFGCVGNIAKISAKVLLCWKHIIDRCPSSKILIRSINFVDPAAETATRRRFADAGFSENQVDFLRPTGGIEFFESYNDIDIILDTFPFNGGTTTCFATYMGVPVVTWAGESLISRVGLSILANLGTPELAVSNADDYIAKALQVAGDLNFISNFRATARSRFKASSLGNGRLFAAEFETACKELLARKVNGVPPYVHSVEVLPADELIRRAYSVLRKDQPEAAERILRHCLEHYPGNGSAHILVAHQMSANGNFAEAANYLLARQNLFNPAEQVASLLTVTRFQVMNGDLQAAKTSLGELSEMPISDEIDRMQLKLFEACFKAPQTERHSAQLHRCEPRRVRILVPCDEPAEFAEVQENISQFTQHLVNWRIDIQRCDEREKIDGFRSLLESPGIDIAMIMQRNVRICSMNFLVDLADSLLSAEVVGVSGATRWTRIDWRLDEFELRAAGAIATEPEVGGSYEARWEGTGTNRLCHGMAVLGGELLAFSPDPLRKIEFDDELTGADLLIEEDWSNRCFEAGFRLLVDRNLGVLVDGAISFDARYRGDGRLHISKKKNIDPFAILRDDHTALSVPTKSLETAKHTLDNFAESMT